ncbi:zinc-finger-containing protein [uncultured Photobacterium sp.]|uniref:zinc-finger-containing protein n=1 Tax=uncultured Photobacterium sp. TaxID=173973 RepID=UPI00262A26E6|nr:zinc-finger-containing protein [uncultured Photobacterium sp.]
MDKFKPSKTAARRVRDRLAVPKRCPHCSSKVVVKHHSEVFNRVYSDWPWLYCCTHCDARVGMHPSTRIPLGTLADAKTRTARRTAKEQFLQWAKQRGYSRTRSYQMLSSMLDIKLNRTHFGWFDADTCKRVMSMLDAA